MNSPKAIIAPIRVNCLKRPLWREHLVMTCLDIPRRCLLGMIESGKLPWCWNVARDGQGKVKELRVLGYSVLELQAGPMAEIGRSRSLKLPEVLTLIGLPEKRETIRATELQRMLWINPDMIRKLGHDGQLEKVNETLPKTGPNASPHYTRASVAKFLENRRLYGN